MKRCLPLLAFAVLYASSALGTTITYTAVLTGAAESPTNGSPGTGSATVVYNSIAHTLDVSVVFSGLISTDTAAQIQCCTAVPGTGIAGVATETPSFAGFPLGVTAGVFSNTFDLSLASSWNPSFITSAGGTIADAEAALAAGLAADEAYLNIHTVTFPGGEIRGFLAPAQVPEPGTLSLLALGAASLITARRRRRV